MRTVVVGASSGLGRAIAIGLAQRGARVAMLARRRDRLERAAAEAGDALAIPCDVTDDASCRDAIARPRRRAWVASTRWCTQPGSARSRVWPTSMPRPGGGRSTPTSSGASLITAAALPHLSASKGTAVYLSSVSASLTPPWPGLGAYVVSKAALDKLVDAWRVECPDIGFTRLVVGDCGGGEGESMTGFADSWDTELATELGTEWFTRGYISGTLIAIDDLIAAVDGVLRAGPSLSMPTVTVTPRRDSRAPRSRRVRLRSALRSNRRCNHAVTWRCWASRMPSGWRA